MKQTSSQKAFSKLSDPLEKAFIYVITLSIASNQVLAAQAEFTTHNDMHRFSSQLLSHAPHSGVSVGQKNEEHVNQQENKRKLLLFPILEIKTTAVRGSTCESGICSPQVLLRIHIKPRQLHTTDCTRLYTASENRMMTEWGQGADLLTDSCLLAACSRTLSKDREILSQNSKPTLQGAYWSNQDV